ncbi:unnamed protein product [Lota lota]
MPSAFADDGRQRRCLLITCWAQRDPDGPNLPARSLVVGRPDPGRSNAAVLSDLRTGLQGLRPPRGSHPERTTASGGMSPHRREPPSA